MSFSFMEHWPLKNIIYLLHTDEKYWVSKENNSIKLKSLLSFFLLLYSSLAIGSYVVHMTITKARCQQIAYNVIYHWFCIKIHTFTSFKNITVCRSSIVPLHGTPDLLLTLRTRKQIAPSTRIKDSSIKGGEENSSAYILLTANYFVGKKTQHILTHISANQAVFHKRCHDSWLCEPSFQLSYMKKRKYSFDAYRLGLFERLWCTHSASKWKIVSVRWKYFKGL